uniref:Uncharacterized protein n=1 Tax=Avena sativa TaxID=4498 RepID=A0ACD5ZRC3_AVESA
MRAEVGNMAVGVSVYQRRWSMVSIHFTVARPRHNQNRAEPDRAAVVPSPWTRPAALGRGTFLSSSAHAVDAIILIAFFLPPLALSLSLSTLTHPPPLADSHENKEQDRDLSSPLDCADPRLFHLMMRSAIDASTAIQFTRFGRPVTGDPPSASCVIACPSSPSATTTPAPTPASPDPAPTPPTSPTTAAATSASPCRTTRAASSAPSPRSATSTVRKFRDVEPGNYWHHVCEGEAERALAPPHLAILGAKQASMMSIVDAIISSMQPDFDSVHADTNAVEDLKWKIEESVDAGRQVYLAEEGVNMVLVEALKANHNNLHYVDQFQGSG